MTKKTWIILILALVAVLVIGVVVGVVVGSLMGQSHDEPYQYTQSIPEDQLQSMSTKQLIEVVLEHPHLAGMLYHYEHRGGFHQMTEKYNGVEELMRREDRADQLFDLYCHHKKSETEEAYELLKLECMEIMLVQPEIYDLLSDSQKQKLEELADDDGYYKSTLQK